MAFSQGGRNVELGAISNDVTDQSADRYCKTYIQIYPSVQISLYLFKSWPSHYSLQH